MILVGIYDRKADHLEQLYTQTNDTMAHRSFEQSCSDPSSMLSKYPDFELWKYADIDEKTGKVIPCEQLLVRNSVFIKKEAE